MKTSAKSLVTIKTLHTGLIAVPINSMMSVNGNCSYKFSSPHNYVLPHGICKIKFSEREGGETLVFERRHCPDLLR